MSYKIIPTPFFTKEFKKLLKKYSSLKKDLSIVINALNANPKLGESIGNNCYKIRDEHFIKKQG